MERDRVRERQTERCRQRDIDRERWTEGEIDRVIFINRIERKMKNFKKGKETQKETEEEIE